MNKKQTSNNALTVALNALQEYDKFGYIRNHQLVIKTLLMQLSENDDYAEETIVDQDLIETSAILVEYAIQKAKKKAG